MVRSSGHPGYRGGCLAAALLVCLVAVVAATLWGVSCGTDAGEPVRPPDGRTATRAWDSGEAEDAMPAAWMDPDVLGAVGAPAVCRENGTLWSYGENALGIRVTWLVDGGLQETATSLVEELGGIEGSRLEYWGYLDLLGNVWGCVVAGGGLGVRLYVVDERESDDVWTGEERGEGPCTVTAVLFGRDDSRGDGPVDD